jgi:DNA-binding phage protein
MAATHLQDGPSQTTDGQARLRVEVYDTLAAAKGYSTVAAQAVWHGVSRSTMFRLRGGDMPSLSTALRIAADLGVAVEVIWERVPA